MATTAPMFLELELEQRQQELELELLAQQEQQQKNSDEERLRRGKRTLLAAEKGRLMELVQLVHQDPQLVFYADDDGYTPLHRACYSNNRDCAKYLLKHGADIEARTSDGWTPLHCAVRWNNVDLADFLVNSGADVNAKSVGGNTPLHVVASNGRYSITCDIIQLLLYHPDCDYSSRNDGGDTAYDIARRSGPFWKLWSGVETLLPDGNELKAKEEQEATNVPVGQP